MQPHGFQSWRGCTETVSLARAVVAPHPEFTPELLAERLRQPAPASETRLSAPTFEATRDRSIARTEEVAPPVLEIELSLPSTTVESPREPNAVTVSNLPARQASKGLWGRLTRPAHLQSASLQVIPDEPGEVRYRVWVDPVRDATPFALSRAHAKPCPLEKLPDPDASQAVLSWTDAACAPGSPQVEEFSLAGINRSAGSPLESMKQQQIPEPEALLYPATRRLPNAVLS